MCGKLFTRINNFKRHIDSTHNQVTEFQCEYCEGTFVRASTLEKHKINYCQIKFMNALKCTKCDKSFKTKQALSSHIRTHPNNESIIETKCQVCDKVLSRANTLQHHMKTHEVLVNTGSMVFVMEKQDKNFKCSFCPKTFTKKSNIIRHENQYHAALNSS